MSGDRRADGLLDITTEVEAVLGIEAALLSNGEAKIQTLALISR